MSPSNDPKQEVQPEVTQTHPLEALSPTWVKSLPPSEEKALLDELSSVTKLDEDIMAVELQCHLLERFDTIRTELLRTANNSPVPADLLYGTLIDHFGAMATYAAQYSRLFAEKLIDPNSVERLLDLGAGYWNSAIAYEALLPNLKLALGLEGDGEKVRTFEQNRDRLLKPSREIFEMRHADFFTEVASLATEISGASETSPKPFDLALMQSFYPMASHSGSLYSYSERDTKEPGQYIDMLSAVGEVLSPEGKLIVSIDKKDIAESATHLRWFSERLKSSGAIRKDDQRLGIDPSWGVLIPIEVSIYILTKENLKGASLSQD